MIRIETAEFIHEHFSRKNSSLTVRFVLQLNNTAGIS